MHDRRAVLAAASLALCACQGLASGATDEFSKDFSCPRDRIEARDRRDLHPSSFTSSADLPKPPANVAADPARLEVWQRNHKDDRTALDGDEDIEEVRGCGQRAFYECHHSRKYYRAWCSSAPHCTGCDSSADPRDPGAPMPPDLARW